ncbi:putative pectinesterase [Medicago truncatula]|uniref:Putative pectinesterase n=1 Tax=Medicago truncatula TaxID=3880 RepID=A0A396H5I8_MEDTR|nr:putative pectinesterase [Medicago truncatula]
MWNLWCARYLGRHYYKERFIEGSIDFIFGNARSFFEVYIFSKSCILVSFFEIFFFQILHFSLKIQIDL